MTKSISPKTCMLRRLYMLASYLTAVQISCLLKQQVYFVMGIPNAICYSLRFAPGWFSILLVSVIGVSLSEPHNSMTALCTRVCNRLPLISPHFKWAWSLCGRLPLSALVQVHACTCTNIRLLICSRHAHSKWDEQLISATACKNRHLLLNEQHFTRIDIACEACEGQGRASVQRWGPWNEDDWSWSTRGTGLCFYWRRQATHRRYKFNMDGGWRCHFR